MAGCLRTIENKYSIFDNKTRRIEMKLIMEINSVHGDTEDISEALCLLATEFETQGIAAALPWFQF